MTKDVILTISGLQMPTEGEAEPLEVITRGDYYLKNDKHYILYDEFMEGFSDVTKNTIKLQPDCLEITKKGVANVHMVFEKNKKNLSYYNTPFGSLLIGIEATDIQIREQEQNMDVEVSYVLEANYEHLADCTIRMNVKPVGAGDFHLYEA
ncbi:MAG: DUF1934 domain-containing protein [Roseburia sp.]